MGDQREGGIAWTDETWGVLRGCSRVSPGCGGAAGVGGCYAERMAGRFSKPGMWGEGLATIGKQGARWTGNVYLVAEKLGDPLRWRRPRRVFVNSASDVFHDGFTNEEIAAVFGVMAATPRHVYQILTKRPKRMVEWFAWVDDRARAIAMTAPEAMWWRALVCLRETGDRLTRDHGATATNWPLPNVWLGVTAEDQQRADERIPLLLQTPAAVRFVSVEPQLSEVDLSRWLPPPPRGTGATFNTARCVECCDPSADICGDLERGEIATDDTGRCACAACHGDGGERYMAKLRESTPSPTIDWTIQGCESGPGARPFDLAWARSLRDQCAAAGVAYFLKQTIINGKKVSTPPLDGVVHAEFPR